MGIRGRGGRGEEFSFSSFFGATFLSSFSFMRGDGGDGEKGKTFFFKRHFPWAATASRAAWASWQTTVRADDLLGLQHPAKRFTTTPVSKLCKTGSFPQIDALMTKEVLRVSSAQHGSPFAQANCSQARDANWADPRRSDPSGQARVHG